ncbi:MAG: hypothetical protein KDH08_17405, partial [Anaerolineae bacterium]|nr:hypothetical protein [Anaerolineae bacterium]
DGIVSSLSEVCLRLPAGLARLPAWDEFLARQELRRLMPRVEPSLDLGRFHPLLPPDLAYLAAQVQCDLPRFEQLYRAATLVSPPAGLRSQLLELI